MTLAPSRLGLWFALTLALPAAFAGTWVWLQHGGTIERALARERATAEQCLATAAEHMVQELHGAAAQAALPLELGADRRIVGPFARPTALADAPAAVVGIAEQAAGARLASGDRAGAEPFFAHAAADDSLTADGWLAYAELLAARDLAAARAALAKAATRQADAWCGPLPFALLAALREATWLQREAAPDAARAQELGDTMFAAARRVPAATVPVVTAAMIDALPALRDDARLDNLTAAAAAAVHLGTVPAPTTAQPGPDGTVLVPLGDDRLGALPAATIARLRARSLAEAARQHPTVTPEPIADAAAATAAGPTLRVPELGETWFALPAVTPTSALLTQTARTSLALAIATFVLGNLLLWRLTRRELALVRLRADFVDVVSHELRTPLAALSLKAEMLAAGDVPADRVPHYLQTLHGDVRRLGQQVERILDFGRLEQGAPLRREAIPARAVLARGLRAGRSSLRLVQQQLEVDAPRSLPNLVGDVDVLSRALRNLLENAAKYAPAGSTVAVRAFADGRTLVVEVADRGPGVPAAERAAIFQPFVRSSTAPPGTPGSGLGLALVAAAAKAHGGTVDVRARDGGGAVFTLSLPIRDAEAAS